MNCSLVISGGCERKSLEKVKLEREHKTWYKKQERLSKLILLGMPKMRWPGGWVGAGVGIAGWGSEGVSSVQFTE